MSNQVIKKKRLKTSQSASNLPKKESRVTGNKFKDGETKSAIPAKKLKISTQQSLQSIEQQTNVIIRPPLKDLSTNVTAENLSVARQHQSLVSFKNNKSDIFDNITATFNSSKILSAQVLSNVTSQKRHELSSWGLPALIVEVISTNSIHVL